MKIKSLVMSTTVALLTVLVTGCSDSTSDDNKSNNSAPVAHAGVDQAGVTFRSVTLDASLSFDADGDSLNYMWNISAIPVNSAVTLSSDSGSDPSFTPDIAGSYVFELLVNDGITDANTTDSVTINVVDHGSLDNNFSTDGMVLYGTPSYPKDYGSDIVLGSDGSIYVLGIYDSSHYGLWKYKPDGTSDVSFGDSGMAKYYGQGRGVALGVDGSIYVTGALGSETGYTGMTIWKYKVDGTLDIDFDEDGIVVVYPEEDMYIEGIDIAVGSDGLIYVTGVNRDDVTDEGEMMIWKYNSDGSEDTNFNLAYINAADQSGKAISLDENGSIYVVGDTNYFQTLWKYKPNGSFDTSFNDRGWTTDTIGEESYGSGITHDSDGTVYTVGYRYYSTSPSVTVLSKYNADGSIQKSVTTPNIEGSAIALDSDRSIYITGVDNDNNMMLSKYKPDLTLDTHFNGTGFILYDNNQTYDKEVGKAIVIGDDGAIYVTGYSEPDGLKMTIWKYR